MLLILEAQLENIPEIRIHTVMRCLQECFAACKTKSEEFYGPFRATEIEK